MDKTVEEYIHSQKAIGNFPRRKAKTLTKMSMFLLILAGIGMVTAAVVVYQMVVLKSHIRIVESQQIQYLDDDGVTWHPLPVNATAPLDLGNADMVAGDLSVFYMKGINNNNAPIMYTINIDSNYSQVKYEVICKGAESGGVQYAIASGGSFGEGLKLLVKNFAKSNATLGIGTRIDAGASPTDGYAINPTTTISRSEIDSGVVGWTTCA